VVAERAMYVGSTATRPWTGGSVATGVTAPSSTWYFAEGATGSFFGDLGVEAANHVDSVECPMTCRRSRSFFPRRSL
jgi:hypothetical protein